MKSIMDKILWRDVWWPYGQDLWSVLGEHLSKSKQALTDRRRKEAPLQAMALLLTFVAIFHPPKSDPLAWAFFGHGLPKSPNPKSPKSDRGPLNWRCVVGSLLLMETKRNARSHTLETKGLLPPNVNRGGCGPGSLPWDARNHGNHGKLAHYPEIMGIMGSLHTTKKSWESWEACCTFFSALVPLAIFWAAQFSSFKAPGYFEQGI